jgi:hypothetical protein
MSFRQAIPWRVALQHCPPPLRLPLSFSTGNNSFASSFQRTVTVPYPHCLKSPRNPSCVRSRILETQGSHCFPVLQSNHKTNSFVHHRTLLPGHPSFRLPKRQKVLPISSERSVTYVSGRTPLESILPPSGRFPIAADRAKNVNKIGQLARSVNKFPARSFTLRSSFASAPRIMPSLAWLYSLNASASSCRSICVTM